MKQNKWTKEYKKLLKDQKERSKKFATKFSYCDGQVPIKIPEITTIIRSTTIRVSQKKESEAIKWFWSICFSISLGIIIGLLISNF